MLRSLEPKDLTRRFDAASLPIETFYQNTELASAQPSSAGQSRAIRALSLGLSIKQKGYNVFVVGASGTGRTSSIRGHLKDRARSEATPGDVVLVYNFDDRDRPRAIELPAGVGPRVQRVYNELVEGMLRELEKAFEGEQHNEKLQAMEKKHDDHIETLLEEARAAAEKVGFILSRNQGSIQLAIRGEDGLPVDEDVYAQLDAEAKKALEDAAESLQPTMEEALRRVKQYERQADQSLELLLRETASNMLNPLFESASEEVNDLPEIIAHLRQAYDDVLNRIESFTMDPNEQDQSEEQKRTRSLRRRLLDEEEDSDTEEPTLLRYRVNVFVARQTDSGAPVIECNHPIMSNLFGRIVHHVRGGDTATDHTKIRAGELYQANGGYLVISVQDLLQQPQVWEALKRALKNGEIDLDDPGDSSRMVTVAMLRPQSIPLKVKVCLIGTPEFYYMLSRDPEFSKLFKVKVDFDLEMDVDDENIERYLRFMAGVTLDEGLAGVTPDGAARILEHSVRIALDQRKLTTRFGWIADLIREASYLARRNGRDEIDRNAVEEALAARREREGYLEKRILEDIASGRVLIQCSGEEVGQINGLTVLEMGRYAFGQPARITCSVGAGKHNILSVEREADLSGPFHTKGTQIIRGILLNRFGNDVPLNLAATFSMEQNYSEIDGDSASLAETLAMLSALSRVPIRQDIAVTGSIDQRGQVQAVGGLNEKIEGFFRTCKALGSTGPKGVVMPAANARDLCLSSAVVRAVEEGDFAVYTIQNLEEACELMLGRPWDEQGRDDSLYALGLKRLQHFNAVVGSSLHM